MLFTDAKPKFLKIIKVARTTENLNILITTTVTSSVFWLKTLVFEPKKCIENY